MGPVGFWGGPGVSARLEHAISAVVVRGSELSGRPLPALDHRLATVIYVPVCDRTRESSPATRPRNPAMAWIRVPIPTAENGKLVLRCGRYLSQFAGATRSPQLNGSTRSLGRHTQWRLISAGEVRESGSVIVSA